MKKGTIVEVRLDEKYIRHIKDKGTVIIEGCGDSQYRIFSTHRSKFSGLDSLRRYRHEGNLVLFNNGCEMKTSENIYP